MRQKLSELEWIKEFLYKASLIVTLGMFLYVFICAFTEFGSMPFLNVNLDRIGKMIFMITGLLLIGMTYFCAIKVMEKWSEIRCNSCIYGLLALMFFLQIVFLFYMKINLRYDALKVLDEAISVCKTGTVSPEHLDGYFARYTNNYPILFVTVVLLKVGRLLGILNENFAGASMLVGVVNIVAIDIAVFFTVKLSGILFGAKKALLCMFSIFLNPLWYIWVSFYYTNTIAMPFVAIILYLVYCLFVKCEKNGKFGEFEKKDSKRQLLQCILLGCCMVVGVKIRATTVITIIACVLFFCLCHKKEKSEKKLLLRGLFVLIGMLLAFAAFKTAEKKWIAFDYTDTEFPAIHWISMGAAGTGEYNILDEQNTRSYATKEEKSEANWELLQNRLKELGVAGVVSHMFGKLKTTFADAGAGYHSELGVSDMYEDLNLYLVGGKSDFIGFLIQVNYVLGILLAVCALVLYLIKNKKDFCYAVFLNLTGAFLFHMIWEAGNIYSLSFIMLWPLLLLAGIAELENMALMIKEQNRRGCINGISIKGIFINGNFIKGISVTVILLTVVCFAFIWKKMTVNPYTTNDAVVNQYIYEWGDSDELMQGEEIIQSFYGNRAFNRLSFQVRNVLGAQNNASYQIELLDKKLICLEKFEINAADYGDYDFVRLTCRGKNEEESPSKYHIRIRKSAGDEECNLVFLSYKTGNFDAYTKGKYSRGEASFNKDLCFSVYETKEEPYAGRVAFVVVLIAILLYEAVIQIYLRRCLKEGQAQ